VRDLLHRTQGSGHLKSWALHIGSGSLQTGNLGLGPWDLVSEYVPVPRTHGKEVTEGSCGGCTGGTRAALGALILGTKRVFSMCMHRMIGVRQTSTDKLTDTASGRQVSSSEEEGAQNPTDLLSSSILAPTCVVHPKGTMLWHNKTNAEVEQYSVRIKAANSSFVRAFCPHEIK